MGSAPKTVNRTLEEEPLESVVGRLLRRQGKTLATAESCTGGYLGKLLTDIPGSSDFYQGGIISYSNALKIRHLEVSPAALDRWGAVSEPVACQMARGVRNWSGADLGVSVTGIAGPSGEARKNRWAWSISAFPIARKLTPANSCWKATARRSGWRHAVSPWTGSEGI